MVKKANGAISTMKAIGIILMVIGHTQCPTFLLKWIYSFHMPLFFFMSGYCFKEKYLNAPKQFVVARVKGLYFPFVKYCLFFLLLHNICYDLHFYSQGVGGGYFSPLVLLKRACATVFFMSCEDSLLGGFWFLRALFWGALISYAMIRIFRRKLWAGGLCLFLGMLVMKLFHITIPLFMISDWMMAAAMFHYAGYAFDYYEAAVFFLMKRSLWGILALFLLVLQSLLVYVYPLDIFGADWSKAIPCVFMAFSGIMVTFIISLVQSSKEYPFKEVVNYVGQHTLIILAWHFLVFKVVSMIIIYYYNYPLDYLGYFPYIPDQGLWWIAYSFVGIFVPITLLYIKRRIESNFKTFFN